MTHKDALEKILKICHESSDYSRRTQAIHECAMVALGLTHSQRQERHVKSMMWSENYKENRRLSGESVAKKLFVIAVESGTGEKRINYNKHLVEG